MTKREPEEKSNQIISSLWIGPHLSLVELLTIQSFLTNGHRFKLYVYDELLTHLPEGCELADANTILPKSAIFRYKNKSQYGQGKGSVSGFSDIFRYKMLYDYGGWWVDMDVTCLRHFDFEEEYVFRSHHDMPAVGNIMKCPKGSSVMRRSYEEAMARVDANNTDWHLPISILNNNIKHYNLSAYIKSGFSNEDKWADVRKLILFDKPIPENYYCIHWVNENWRTKGLDKNDFKIYSTLGRLLIHFGLIEDNFSSLNKLKNHVRFRFLKGL
jgi:hypothetical protein